MQGWIMSCMVSTHAAGLPGGGYALHGTHSHIIIVILEVQGEIGGWRRRSGVRRCVSRKAHTHLTTWLRPAICATAWELEQPGSPNLRHFTRHCATVAKNMQLHLL